MILPLEQYSLLQEIYTDQFIFVILILGCNNYQGLENSWKRHHDTIEHLWAGLEKMGMEMFVKDKVRSYCFTSNLNSTRLNFSMLPLVKIDHVRDEIVLLLSGRLSVHRARFWTFSLKI